VITEVTVRLRARPEVDETFLVPASRLTASRLPAHVAPMAVEMLNAALARRLRLDTRGDALLVRLGGNAASVAAQRDALGGDRVPTDVWMALREIEPAGAPVWRCSTTPARFAELWAALPSDVLAHATPARGVIRCIGGNPSQLSMAATVIGERLPADGWAALGPGRVRDRLSVGIKATFDPLGLFNPGILG
jgi:hypothetical protein